MAHPNAGSASLTYSSVPKQSSGPSEAIGCSPALKRLSKSIRLRPEMIIKTIKLTRRFKTVKKSALAIREKKLYECKVVHAGGYGCGTLVCPTEQSGMRKDE